MNTDEYTDSDIAVLRQMGIAPKPTYKPKIRGLLWGTIISSALWTLLIWAYIFAARWYR